MQKFLRRLIHLCTLLVLIYRCAFHCRRCSLVPAPVAVNCTPSVQFFLRHRSSEHRPKYWPLLRIRAARIRHFLPLFEGGEATYAPSSTIRHRYRAAPTVTSMRIQGSRNSEDSTCIERFDASVTSIVAVIRNSRRDNEGNPRSMRFNRARERLPGRTYRYLQTYPSFCGTRRKTRISYRSFKFHFASVVERLRFARINIRLRAFP